MTNVLQFPWINTYFKPHRIFFEDAVSVSMSVSMTMWIAWSYNRFSMMNTLVRPIKLSFPSYVESTWLCAFCRECVIYSIHNKLVRRFRAASWSSKEQFITSEKKQPTKIFQSLLVMNSLELCPPLSQVTPAHQGHFQQSFNYNKTSFNENPVCIFHSYKIVTASYILRWRTVIRILPF